MDALTKFQGAQAELSEAEALILAEMQDEENAFDMKLTQIAIGSGGIGRFIMGDGAEKDFNAVVAISQKTRGYWPEAGTGKSPICQSPDSNIAFFDEQINAERFKAAAGATNPHPAIRLMDENKPLPESFSCISCPLNQWGSKHQGGSGRGKACKEMRRLLVLIEDWAMPAIFSLPPTSIVAWDAYCSALRSKRSAYFAVRTKFELDSAKSANGEPYNIVKASMIEPIKDVESLKLVSEIRRQYRDYVSEMPVTAEEYDTVPFDGVAVDQAVDDDDDKTPPF